MALSNMQVFIDNARTLAVEKLAQNIDIFNGATNNTIQLSSDGFSGDLFERSFYNSLASAQRRVDRYAANSAVTPTDLSQSKAVEVKVAGGFGPVRFEPAQMAWIESNEAEAMVVISNAMAEAIMADMVNTSISALVAALSNNPDAVNDVSATEGVNQSNMNTTDGLFGDKQGLLTTRVMSSSSYTKLVGQNITNGNRLFSAGDVTVVDVLGKNIVVTDAPALRVAGTPNKEIILTLVSGAIVIGNTDNLVMNAETTNGNERIESTYQADYDFTMEMLGYSWDTANGGKSPSDADIGTGSNWDVIMDSVKHTAGTVLIADEAK